MKICIQFKSSISARPVFFFKSWIHIRFLKPDADPYFFRADPEQRFFICSDPDLVYEGGIRTPRLLP